MDSSFDHKPEFFSLIAKNSNQQNQKNYIKNIIRDSFEFVARYLNFLPPIDQDIARLYYVDGLSQDQIKKLFGVCQAAISRRVKFIFVRIKFLLKMPSLNPIQVREDLQALFEDDLFEFAYFFYWELAQNRVKYYIETSQSGAANKLIKIIAYLKQLRDTPDTGDSVLERKKYLALVYLDYFEFIYRRSNVITWVFKKSDKYRNQPVFVGDPII
ncbi:MAG: hypothetical protein WC511_03245 [Candidatus Pacearchaeota archaeon]